MKKKPPQKWELQVWRGKRYIDKLDPRGRVIGQRSHYDFRREYTSEASANRAIPNLRRMFPDANIEKSHYEFEAIFWMQRGEPVMVQVETAP